MTIIFISELADKACINYLSQMGSVILTPRDPRLPEGINTHPDLVMGIIDNHLIIDGAAHPMLIQRLNQLEVPYITGSSSPHAGYPGEVPYNAVITKDSLIHHLSYTDPLLLQNAINTGKKLLSVKQGYTKCSMVVVDDHAFITADKGIYDALKDKYEVLLIREGAVALEGHEYGFLGGASGALGDTVIFHGDLSRHPDYERILHFITARGKQVKYFDHFPLTDIGSILCYYKEPKPLPQSSDYKTHVNIPIFISHAGCPNDCVFYNPRKITAKAAAMSLEEIKEQIQTYQSTLTPETYTELAFFGGSFTGIEASLQEAYLKMAKEYKDAEIIQAIRLSTRPDYISKEILDRLAFYGVDLIELGVQSFHDEVLTASNRGHKVTDIYQAASLIKNYGIKLGIQLMVGLPMDTKERSILSAKLAALLDPDCVRIYPTLVIRDTALESLKEKGQYEPLPLETAVDWVKEMYKVFLTGQIPVIRMGLQPTELIAEGKEVLYGPFHPAFRQLVESAYFLECMTEMLKECLPVASLQEIELKCHPRDLSQVIGHHRVNLLSLRKNYPKLRIVTDKSISPMTLALYIHV